MAKSSSENGTGNGRRSNKSAAIREALEQNPKASSKEIMVQLAAKGLKVAPTLIYYVKSKQKRAMRKAKRARVAEASRNTLTANPVQVLLRVKDLAREVGGIRYLKQLVDVLAE
jgi:hypothetical protein